MGWKRRRAMSVVASLVMGASILGGVGVAPPAGALPESHPIQHTTFDQYTEGLDCRTTCTVGRHLVVDVTQPSDGAGPWPVVFFAHGFNTVPANYGQILDQVAAAGFAVVAPRFPESRSDLPTPPNRLFTARQALDIRELLASIDVLSNIPSHPLSRLDPGRVTVMGHSDGGMVAAALLEGGSLAEPRLRGGVVVAGELDHGLSFAPSVPGVLVVHGTADTIAPESGGWSVYDKAAAPKAMLLGEGLTHEGVILGSGARTAAVRAAIVGWLDWRGRSDAGGAGRFWTAAASPGLRLTNTGVGFPGFALDSIGRVESITAAAPDGPGDPTGTIRVTGWVFAPSTPDPIPVRVILFGGEENQQEVDVLADLPRPDVGAFFKNGDRHGFEVTIEVAPDVWEVRVVTVNAPGVQGTQLNDPNNPNDPNPFVVVPFTEPGVPTGLAAHGLAGSASVRWDARPRAEHISTYEVTCSCGQTRTVTGEVGHTVHGASFSGLADGTPVSFTVRATNDNGTSAASAAATATPGDVAPHGAGFVAAVPSRVFDSRPGDALGRGSTTTVDLPPAPPGAVGAVVSVTALVAPTWDGASTYVTVSPAGHGPAGVSSLNLDPGTTGPVSNQVMVPLGDGGDLELFNSGTPVDAFVDLVGWMVDDGGAERVSAGPTRILDTRTTPGTGLGAGQTRTVHLADPGAAAAVSVVLTATNATEVSHLSAWGPGSRPDTSVSNPWPTLPARAANVILPVDANGDIHVYNNSGTVQLVVDLVGRFPVATGTPDATRWHPQTPWRLYDSRVTGGKLAVNQARTVPAPSTAVQANVVGVGLEAPSAHLTIWGDGPWPGTSNLNLVAGQIVAQQVTTGGGTVQVRASAPMHVVIDVSGFWASPADP